LESYEVVQRQLKHFDRILPGDWEVLIMDDGSIPSIKSQLDEKALKILEKDNFQLIETNDFRSWSQPKAFNDAVQLAEGKYIFITDIDHILTKEAIQSVNNYFDEFHKMVFPRTWGILDEVGNICTDDKTLMEYGLPKERLGQISSHANTFCMLREDFLTLGGYNEKDIGECSNIDNDLNRRYGELARPKGWKTLKGAMTYVFPNPREDKCKLFHGLREHKKRTGSYKNYKSEVTKVN